MPTAEPASLTEARSEITLHSTGTCGLRAGSWAEANSPDFLATVAGLSRHALQHYSHTSRARPRQDEHSWSRGKALSAACGSGNMGTAAGTGADDSRRCCPLPDHRQPDWRPWPEAGRGRLCAEPECGPEILEPILRSGSRCDHRAHRHELPSLLEHSKELWCRPKVYGCHGEPCCYRIDSAGQCRGRDDRAAHPGALEL
jgi:hypothetical protein